MKNIAIFQSDLRVGGIQKALINLLKNIDYNKYAIDLYIFEDDKFYIDELNNQVNIVHLKKYNFFNRFVFFDVLKLFRRKRVTEKAYDLAIDFNSYWNECSLNALLVNAKKRIMWIHNDISIKKREEIKYKILFFFFKGKYKYFDKFVAVSPGVVEPFMKETGITDKKITVIPNCIDAEEIIEKSCEPVELEVDSTKYNVISVGRLCHQKGFDVLVEKINEIVKIRKDIHFYFAGKGPEQEKIKKQIEKYKLNDYITLLGNQKNPFKYMNLMDGFVLMSRYEGQGIVLLEAKALGLEIFIPEHLEKYNSGIKGCDDIVDAIAKAVKKEKNKNSLDEYNNDVMNKMDKLFCE